MSSGKREAASANGDVDDGARGGASGRGINCDGETLNEPNRPTDSRETAGVAVVVLSAIDQDGRGHRWRLVATTTT
jgi:hypothetical protein